MFLYPLLTLKCTVGLVFIVNGALQVFMYVCMYVCTWQRGRGSWGGGSEPPDGNDDGKKKQRSGILAIALSAAHMSQTRAAKLLTISEVAADWH